LQQIQEENLRRTTEKILNTPTIPTKPRVRSIGKTIEKKPVANKESEKTIKRDSSNKSLKRESSNKTLKANKSTLYMTNDDISSNRGNKEIKTPVRTMKKNNTLTSINKSPSKQLAKANNITDKKGNISIYIDLKRNLTTGKLSTVKSTSSLTKSSKITITLDIKSINNSKLEEKTNCGISTEADKNFDDERISNIIDMDNINDELLIAEFPELEPINYSKMLISTWPDISM
jgi:hypothetical protein